MASRKILAIWLAVSLLVTAVFSGCLSSNPNANGGRGAPAAGPTLASPPASAVRAPSTASATVVSQAQPGFSGTVVSGVVSFQGAAPPDASSLYLGLVKSADDRQPRTCIDAARDPINEVGQFYAQVSCKPQPGDQLVYVLIIGPEGERNWHRGVVPMPSDLTNVHIDVQQ